MELKEFIKTAVTDIAGAVSELQNELQNGTIINPTISRGDSVNAILINNEVRMMERLHFDIAVTVTETTELNGNARVGISVIGAKLNQGNAETTENVSRMTFSIPVVLPSTHVKTALELKRDGRQ